MAFWDGILNWLGYGPDEEITEADGQRRERLGSNNRAKLVSLPTARNNTRLIISRPQSFDQAAALAENLKNYRPVIINLEDLPVDEARQIIDFLSGAIYALGGRVRRITSGIFLFASSNIDLEADQEEQTYTGIDWLQAAGRD